MRGLALNGKKIRLGVYQETNMGEFKLGAIHTRTAKYKEKMAKQNIPMV